MGKKIAWKKCRKTFLKAIFFAFEKTFFKVANKVLVIVLHAVSIKHGLRTTDSDYGLGIKHGLGIKRGLSITDWV